MYDERLVKINQERDNALQQSNNVYQGLFQDNQNLLNQQNEYANQYEQTQNSILDKTLAFNEQKIEQQKETARENKAVEERKALNDYTAFNNPYGYQAESFASNGLLNTGVSETAKLGSFNTYQNRLATANKVLQNAILEYDNAINEARLNYDVQKAQNALAKFEMQLKYSENFYNKKSDLSLSQLNNNQSLNDNYYNRYQTEYRNIQNEKAQAEAIRQWELELAEKQRQYNESLAYQKQQDSLAQANWQKEYALKLQSTKSESLDDQSIDNNQNQQISTNWYQGLINPDTQYGTFNTLDSNGVKYQPDNVDGDKLSNSGYRVKDLFVGQITGATGADMSGQKIWKTNDGKYYIWDGSVNSYIDITRKVNIALNTAGPYKW